MQLQAWQAMAGMRGVERGTMNEEQNICWDSLEGSFSQCKNDAAAANKSMGMRYQQLKCNLGNKGWADQSHGHKHDSCSFCAFAEKSASAANHVGREKTRCSA